MMTTTTSKLERFGDLGNYTTDELIGLGMRSMLTALKSGGDPAEGASGRLTTEVAIEAQRRRSIRNAWLDHCNGEAGEVIA